MSNTTTQTPPQNQPATIRVDDQSARYWEILQHNIEWLRFSETKAALILTVYGIIFTIAYTNSTAVFSSMKASTVVTIMIFLYGGLSLTSIGYAFACINPNLKNKNFSSIIYFGHISKQHISFKEYKTYAQSILDDEEKFTDQITEQIYLISKIAWNKFVWVSWALRFSIISLVVMILAVFIYIIPLIG